MKRNFSCFVDGNIAVSFAVTVNPPKNCAVSLKIKTLLSLQKVYFEVARMENNYLSLELSRTLIFKNYILNP
jgi:hypothetical protein